jgi:hypothetical protein
LVKKGRQYAADLGVRSFCGEIQILYVPNAVLRIRDVYPGSEFFPIPDPESRVKKISDPGSGSASKSNLSILTQKIVSKLSEIWSGMIIPDPDLDFLPIPDPGSKRHRIPDPNLQHYPNGAEYPILLIKNMVKFKPLYGTKHILMGPNTPGTKKVEKGEPRSYTHHTQDTVNEIK